MTSSLQSSLSQPPGCWHHKCVPPCPQCFKFRRFCVKIQILSSLNHQMTTSGPSSPEAKCWLALSGTALLRQGVCSITKAFYPACCVTYPCDFCGSVGPRELSISIPQSSLQAPPPPITLLVRPLPLKRPVYNGILPNRARRHTALLPQTLLCKLRPRDASSTAIPCSHTPCLLCSILGKSTSGHQFPRAPLPAGL